MRHLYNYTCDNIRWDTRIFIHVLVLGETLYKYKCVSIRWDTCIIFPLYFTAWWWVLYRWAETCSFQLLIWISLYWRYFPYICVFVSQQDATLKNILFKFYFHIKFGDLPVMFNCIYPSLWSYWAFEDISTNDTFHVGRRSLFTLKGTLLRKPINLYMFQWITLRQIIPIVLECFHTLFLCRIHL